MSFNVFHSFLPSGLGIATFQWKEPWYRPLCEAETLAKVESGAVVSIGFAAANRFDHVTAAREQQHRWRMGIKRINRGLLPAKVPLE